MIPIEITEGWKPVIFYPYTSSVHKRFLEIGCGSTDELFTNLEKSLIDLFNFNGIKAYPDNKIVFELEKNGQKIFIGFYDWILSIGFEVESEHLNEGR